MNNRTVHENTQPQPTKTRPGDRALARIDTPVLLSTLWIAVLFADVLRGVHETLRPGFVEELAFEGTNYGREVTDATLLLSGFVLVFIISVVVLARILPRRSNRRVNVVAAVMMAAGVLASWPKDPDDFVFGAFQIVGAILVMIVCARWSDDTSATTQTVPAPPVAAVAS